jgi:hypothetical protein
VQCVGGRRYSVVQTPSAKFHSFLAKNCKKQVPDKSTLCKNYLDACYQSVNPKVHSVNPREHALWHTFIATSAG